MVKNEYCSYSRTGFGSWHPHQETDRHLYDPGTSVSTLPPPPHTLRETERGGEREEDRGSDRDGGEIQRQRDL